MGLSAEPIKLKEVGLGGKHGGGGLGGRGEFWSKRW